MATAYAALVSLFNDLDLIQDHPTHSFSFDNNQIQSLVESVCFLIDFMETCDYHGAADAELLENKIADATHAAQDVILSRVADQINSGSTLRDKARPSPLLLHLLRGHIIKDKARRGLDLQKVIEDMSFVTREAIKIYKVDQPTFSSIAAAAATPSSSTAAATSTPLTFQKNTMVGFDEVLYQLLDLLTGEAGRRVIPIVAMGGAGKTTLARNAFQHKLVVEYFDICLWATISQQYDVEEILNQLLGSKSADESVADLGDRLYKSLCGRRYLIVLDDMWSSEAWDEIKFYFPQHKDNENRIVVTSRQSHLADHLTNSPCFPLHHLDNENCWILFCEKVFGDKQGCPPELEELGQKIVKKCSGLPLAIVVVGGYLRNSSKTQEYWENVSNHMVSILSLDVSEPCLDILSLSYNYLPVHLKPCFLYMGILKEDQSIEASRLIKFWIGEGFIKPSKTQSLEEVAESCLKDLVDRNLILACKRNWSGKIMSCELHDIVRELCLKIVEKEKFICVLDVLQAIHGERRLVFPGYFGHPHNRSLRVLNEVDEIVKKRKLPCVLDKVVEKEKFLRVLHALNGALSFINPHLRQISCTSFDTTFHFPLLSRLWSLQTLIVTKSDQTITAPLEFWEMLQLRHLEVNGICLPNPPPSYIGMLVQGNLQTLLGVENLRLSEEVCKRIPHIKKLGIKYTNLGIGCDELRSLYRTHNLSLLHKLESLECSFPIQQECPGFVQSFRFPDSLKELTLTGRCHLCWEELSQLAGSLPLLETLYLGFDAVIGSEWNAVEEHFDNLKSLTIDSCVSLVNFNLDSSHFPALRELVLLWLPKLHELPSCIGELSSLQRISLRRCSVSLAMSAMRILVEQEREYGNMDLQLEVSFPHVEPDKKMSFKEKMQEEGLDSDNLRLIAD